MATPKPDLDDAKFYVAYNSRTKQKLAHRVPGAWFRLFPHLRPTPVQKASIAKHAEPAAEPEAAPAEPTPDPAPTKGTTTQGE